MASRNLLAIVIFALFAGCGGPGEGDERHCNDGGSPNKLEGSYCEDVSMIYTEVRFLTVSTALRIEYVRPLGSGSEKTLQIILDGSRVVLEPNVDIQLLATGAQIRRVLAEAQITLTQEIEASSTIRFHEYNGAVGSRVSGQFAILFKSGRTLSGEFEGVIEEARPQS
jgi:hypothetical protein